MDNVTRHPVGGSRVVRHGRLLWATVGSLVCLALVVGCGTSSQTARPETSIEETSAPSRRPATTPTPRPPSEPPSTPASSPSWPDGWDAQLCDLFAETVITQELAVDVGRALDENARDDALALARELEVTAQGAGGLLADLPEWEPFEELRPALNRMLEIGDAMGRFYGRYIARDREPALERVGELIDEQRPVVGDVLAGLGELEEDYGLSCPDHEFVLESP